MVMEETPSPENVGREFVRQYYTLLNKAPVHLHRFYNNASSFIHGGLDASDRDVEPVIGQKEIHNRIQQLNFQDCHAKISQVDSQATLGNGVVVQVTGELSNGGQPMRRFTQTFVLASQSPRQYYVHNDIFRYQDFVFSEEDSDWGYGSTRDDAAPLQPPPAALPAPYFPPPPVVASSAPAVLPNPVIPLQPVLQEHVTHNGHQEDANISIPMNVSDSSCGDVDVGGQDFEPEVELVASPTAVSFATPTPILEPAPIVSTEPKTYANLVKSGQTASHFVNNQNTAAATTRLSSTQTRIETGPTVTNVASSTPNVSANQHRPRPTRTPRSESNDTGAPAPGGNQPTPSTGPSRRFSDSQQLFLGNLPHSATKDEIRQIFEKFGNIVDLRVHNKLTSGPVGAGPPNNASGRVLPNYAFLIFEEPQSAQACLTSGPLYYPSADSPESVVLNVQEKKSRMGPGGPGGNGRGSAGGGPRVPRTPGFNNRRNSYQPQRR